MRWPVIVMLGSSLALGGCSTLFRGPVTHAASPMTLQGSVKFDISNLLAANPSSTSSRAGQTQPPAPERDLEVQLANFLSRTRPTGGENATSPSEVRKEERNRIAGALLLASDRNCDVYLENLRGAQTFWRSAFSLAGLGLGAAGAIVTEADTTRLLSGLAGASTGAIGKLDETLMGGMAAEVVVAGIRAGREPMRKDLIDAMKQPYVDWPVEVAIADVLRYHGRCNVMSGLSTAQKAVEREAQSATSAAAASAASAAAVIAANAAAVAATKAAADATNATQLAQQARERVEADQAAATNAATAAATAATRAAADAANAALLAQQAREKAAADQAAATAAATAAAAAAASANAPTPPASAASPPPT